MKLYKKKIANLFVFSQEYKDQIITSEDKPALNIGATYYPALRKLGFNIIVHAPSNPSRKILQVLQGLRYCFTVRSTSLNVLVQGYPIIAAWLASFLRRKIPTIIHTWKVPGIGSSHFSAKIYDWILSNVIRKSMLVVLASKRQEALIRKRFPHVNTLWVPVTPDVDWWKPGYQETDVLLRNKLVTESFLLVIGNVDRDEVVAAHAAKALGIRLVRVTRDPMTAERAQKAYNKEGINDFVVLLKIPVKEVRDLYRTAWSVLITSNTDVHPAGLTCLTEALACGAAVAIPEGQDQEGYVTNGKDAITFPEVATDAIVSAMQPLRNYSFRQQIKVAARKRAVDFLAAPVVAARVFDALVDILDYSKR